MSKETDKAKEKARQKKNDQNRKKADHWKQVAKGKKAEHDKVKAQLERLKSARRALNNQITAHKSFEGKLNQVSPQIPKSEFKGTLRTKVDNQLKTVSQAAKSDENHHQNNLGRLDLKITELELKQGDLASAVKDALATAQNFLSAIF